MIKTLFTTFMCLLIFYNLNYSQTSGEMIRPVDGAENDQFGFSVDLYDSSYLAGAIRQNNKGAVYISPNSKLPIPFDLETGDQLGYSISYSHLSGVALVGAPFDDINADSLNAGAVYSYYHYSPPDGSSYQWVLEQKLLTAKRNKNVKFGNSVSVSGNYAIIGAPGESGINKQAIPYFCAAYIFEWVFTGNGMSECEWQQVSKITRNDYSDADGFGSSVSISGDYAIIGASRNEENVQSGCAYIYQRIDNSWILQKKLTPDGIDTNYSLFGESVFISGDYAVIGAPGDQLENGPSTGAVYIFKRINNDWVKQTKLTASDAEDNDYYDYFGKSVSKSNDYIIVGAPGSSSAYIFHQLDESWIQTAKLIAKKGWRGDGFGKSVAISNDNAIVGAHEPFALISGTSGYVCVYPKEDWIYRNITITSPNGGENWQAESEHNITWNSSSTSGDIKIEYSADDGSTWKTVSSYTNDDESYNWTLPNTPSTRCYVKVSDIDTVHGVFDQSDAPFTISAKSLPDIPTLVSPTNGSTDISTNPELKWNASNGAISYRLQVSTSSNFNITIFDSSDIKSTSKIIHNLAMGTTYYWRVNATNTAGTSDWSSTWEFATTSKMPVPIVPSPASPSNGVAGVSQDPTLRWESSDWADTYGLQVSLLSDFSTIENNQTGLTDTSFQINNLTEATTYYWHVNATNSIGTCEWSSTEHFTTLVLTGMTKAVTVTGDQQIAYRLISIPVNADDAKPATIFSDFGDYDNNKWRLFELSEDQKNIEFNEISQIETGKGYWLISNIPGKEINTGKGNTNPTGQPFSIPLYSGWTLIGNPFRFQVPLTNVQMENDSTLKIWSYNGEWVNSIDSIQSFEGYAVSSVDQTNLLIDPDISNSLMKLNEMSEGENEDISWAIRIKATCQKAKDSYNMAVACNHSSSKLDKYDSPEPPTIGEYVSVYFPHPEWGNVFSKYTIDARPVKEDYEVWDFEVRTNINDIVNLKIEDINQVPAYMEIWLLDESNKVLQNLRECNNYSLKCTSAKDIKLLKLIVGLESHIEDKINTDQYIPGDYVLQQNFPNPFNMSTTIRYGLPEAGRVSITIYNLLGELVIKLIQNEYQNAGYHNIIWTGKDQTGQLVTSGIYICRLRGEGFIITKKMTFTK